MDESKVTYRIEVEQDDTPIRGNAIASGDAEVDQRYENEIIERLNRGDVWAWCGVKVIAELDGFEGESSWLGGCSYKGERDFREPGGYFDDLCAEALDALRATIEDTSARLARIGGAS